MCKIGSSLIEHRRSGLESSMYKNQTQMETIMAQYWIYKLFTTKFGLKQNSIYSLHIFKRYASSEPVSINCLVEYHLPKHEIILNEM